MTSEPADAGVEPLAYRHALGRFATGIAVITTRADGLDHAMTVNSFASVSLHPPLVLFSCEKVARFHEAVTAAGSWVASVLGADQVDASRWFAKRGRPFDDQFAAFPTRVGQVVDALVLEDSLATIECRTVGAYEGGDHTVIVGEVVAVTVSDGLPLIYFGGGYRTLSDQV
ncbi:MAG: 3-hydroxy-9,10-secoandrosta,3,5(10)-triene-9,17-dione monooxygenase reductase component [Frankiales bacterium]|jgi:flavin reductase (DIM6/NTAB) family NADH-FMN oxidoreductase RutF|nr:3-hydroxy-9,10-secoandrosta,3,5(10)-triene-9,17-dione monooxygenase reductase component [Frankiales bacterium]MDX6208985.1 3-hydroxy-9,10-secoandrosta,3,5(10)-triene-9,17-dione monooxygenase reductase component [Frankiales bacterium]MDX6211857.1 3-hydroxy-9,10-secoandrosta,3,5(10)-triene-9,17-dione monooxygenase reductase component [Frankiales bacterium]